MPPSAGAEDAQRIPQRAAEGPAFVAKQLTLRDHAGERRRS